MTGKETMASIRNLILVLIVAATPLNVAAQNLTCRPSEKSMLQVELLFGRNIGGRLGVSEKKWSRFVEAEITPRFPQGLTVLEAGGQWRDTGNKRIVRERSKIVVLIVPADTNSYERLDAIVAAYKDRFNQQAVGMVARPVCTNL